MKSFLGLSWSLFLLSIALKLFHIPGGAPLLILSALLLLIHSIIYLIRNARTSLSLSFLHLSTSLLTIYLVFRIQYWAFSTLVLGVALLATLTCFILIIVKRDKFRIPQILLALFFIFSLGLSRIHSHYIYYFFNLNSITNSESRDLNYIAWDKYSWFLYIAGRQADALDANEKAQVALARSKDAGHPDELGELVVNQHRQEIVQHDWRRFP